MEPLRRTGTFKRRLTSADANNIATVLDMNTVLAPYKIFEGDYFVESSALIEEFKVTVGLFSLLAASYPNTTPLMSDAKKEAEIAKIRDTSQKMSLGIYTARGNGPWEYESEAVLINLGGAENHVPLLVPFLSTNESFLIDADFKLGVKIEAKWQHPLKTGDYLVVKGTYRQTINFLKKNGSDLDELNNRVKTLESLLSIFGGASASQAGTNGLVPAPGVGDNNKLLKGDRNWQSTSATGLALLNAADAAAVRSQLATPGLTGNTFTGPQVITDTTASTNTTTGAHVVAGGVGIAGFTTLGDNCPIKIKKLTGTTAASDGGNTLINHALDSTKIVGVLGIINHVAGSGLPPGYTFLPGYQFSITYTSTQMALYLQTGNSSNITNKPFTILILYTN